MDKFEFAIWETWVRAGNAPETDFNIEMVLPAFPGWWIEERAHLDRNDRDIRVVLYAKEHDGAIVRSPVFRIDPKQILMHKDGVLAIPELKRRSWYKIYKTMCEIEEAKNG